MTWWWDEVVPGTLLAVELREGNFSPGNVCGYEHGDNGYGTRGFIRFLSDEVVVALDRPRGSRLAADGALIEVMTSDGDKMIVRVHSYSRIGVAR